MKHVCTQCRKRPPLFLSKKRHSDGRIRVDEDHVLCQQCHRALVNSLRIPAGETRPPRRAD